MTNPAIRRALAALAAAFLAVALPAEERHGPLYIDLGAYPLFVRVGFDPASILEPPMAGQAGWELFPPAGPGGRNVRPVELALPGIPRRTPFSLASFPTMEFTYLIPFSASAEMVRLVGDPSGPGAAALAPLIPGIHFAGLGDGWEVFLNGIKVRSELRLDAAGRVAAHRSNRDIFFPLDGSLFREGRNVVAVRVVCDPTFPPAGFHQAAPYYIDSYETVARNNAELWPVVLCGLYLFVGLYHLFMFLVRPQDRHNLFYGLFSADLAIYLFVRTHTVNLFVLDSQLLFRVELCSLFLILPLVGAFLETLNDSRVKRATRWYAAFCGLLAALTVVAPIAFAHDVLRVWQLSGLAMALWYFGYEILGRFLRDGHRRWKRLRGAEDAPSLAWLYFKSLGSTPIGNLLLGGFILFATAVFDIVDAVVMQWDLVLTQYGFFLFTMGTALILANRLGFLHDQLAGLNQNLEERLRVLTETGARLAASERRYRSLFEGTSEPVALLDDGLRFIEGNRSAVDFFGLDRPGRKDYRLEEAVYAEEREGSLPVELLREAAASQKDRAGPRELSLRLKTPLGEGRPCRLRMERIDSLERKEILLRVQPEAKDALLDAFLEGRERYEIESSLTAADEACRAATARLARYLPEEDSGLLAVCLREILVNAVEHGNLEIGFEDKSEAQREGRYFELLQKRRQEGRYRNRRVLVEYSVSAERATYRVTDEGKGFDHRAIAGPDGAPSPELLEHGRGIFMTMGAFDRVVYNEAGNQVTLVKYFGARP